MTSPIGEQAAELQIETWVQGEPCNISTHLGKVILVEVFQVNCPGCFVHALPEAIRLHHLFNDNNFVVLGLATAFEDFDKNTLDNLNRLIKTGEMTGDPLTQLQNTGYLNDNILDYQLPFAVAMDKLEKNNMTLSKENTLNFIHRQIPDFASWSNEKKQPIYEKAHIYLAEKTYNALTFDCYQLQGTPSSIMIDKQGVLRDVSFGMANHLEPMIRDLLLE